MPELQPSPLCINAPLPNAIIYIARTLVLNLRLHYEHKEGRQKVFDIVGHEVAGVCVAGMEGGGGSATPPPRKKLEN